ncbi:hypothetical protein [Clostridium senegalense]|uniref:hypothetical protein n=1 Tax=Clostridium senegalense TaxID=1465809 RepID=UPI000288E61F|nr:hypothetical protein [Clostridium senegalense]
MNFKKGLLILMCTLTLVGCSSSKEENKKEETKPKTESTEKKDDNKIKEETKKEDEKKNTDSEDKENVSQKENGAVENKQQQTITEEKTSNENVSKPKDETITEESAKDLIKVADSKDVLKNIEDGGILNKVEYSPDMGWCDVSKHWDIPQEEFIYFTLKNDSHVIRNYVVGMSSKNVYRISSQGGVPAYVMENGERVKEYKWKE